MKNILSIIFCFVVCVAGYGQLTLNLALNLNPDPDPREWPTQDGLLIVTAINNTAQTYEYRYQGRLLLDGEVVMDNDIRKMPVETMDAFDTHIREVQDVLPIDAIQLHGDIEATYIRTGSMPGGDYLLCAQMLDLNNQPLSPEMCVPMRLTAYQQPTIIFPTPDILMQPDVPPVLSWTPVVPQPPFPVDYVVRLVEAPIFTVDNISGLRDSKLPSIELEKQTLLRKDIKQLTSKSNAEKNFLGALADLKDNPGTQQRGNVIRDFNSGRSHDNQGWEAPESDWTIITIPEDLASESNGTVGFGGPLGMSGGGPRTLDTESLRALQYGFPMWEESLTDQQQILLPPDVQLLPNRSYVWQVQALNAVTGRPIGDNEGTSAPSIFTLGAGQPQASVDGDIFLAAPSASKYRYILTGGEGLMIGLKKDNTWALMIAEDRIRELDMQMAIDKEGNLTDNDGKKLRIRETFWVNGKIVEIDTGQEGSPEDYRSGKGGGAPENETEKKKPVLMTFTVPETGEQLCVREGEWGSCTEKEFPDILKAAKPKDKIAGIRAGYLLDNSGDVTKIQIRTSEGNSASTNQPVEGDPIQGITISLEQLPPLKGGSSENLPGQVYDPDRKWCWSNGKATPVWSGDCKDCKGKAVECVDVAVIENLGLKDEEIAAVVAQVMGEQKPTFKREQILANLIKNGDGNDYVELIGGRDIDESDRIVRTTKYYCWDSGGGKSETISCAVCKAGGGTQCRKLVYGRENPILTDDLKSSKNTSKWCITDSRIISLSNITCKECQNQNGRCIDVQTKDLDNSRIPEILKEFSGEILNSGEKPPSKKESVFIRYQFDKNGNISFDLVTGSEVSDKENYDKIERAYCDPWVGKTYEVDNCDDYCNEKGSTCYEYFAVDNGLAGPNEYLPGSKNKPTKWCKINGKIISLKGTCDDCTGKLNGKCVDIKVSEKLGLSAENVKEIVEGIIPNSRKEQLESGVSAKIYRTGSGEVSVEILPGRFGKPSTDVRGGKISVALSSNKISQNPEGKAEISYSTQLVEKLPGLKDNPQKWCKIKGVVSPVPSGDCKTGCNGDYSTCIDVQLTDGLGLETGDIKAILEGLFAEEVKEIIRADVKCTNFSTGDYQYADSCGDCPDGWKCQEWEFHDPIPPAKEGENPSGGNTGGNSKEMGPLQFYKHQGNIYIRDDKGEYRDVTSSYQKGDFENPPSNRHHLCVDSNGGVHVVGSESDCLCVSCLVFYESTAPIITLSSLAGPTQSNPKINAGKKPSTKNPLNKKEKGAKKELTLYEDNGRLFHETKKGEFEDVTIMIKANQGTDGKPNVVGCVQGDGTIYLLPQCGSCPFDTVDCINDFTLITKKAKIKTSKQD